MTYSWAERRILFNCLQGSKRSYSELLVKSLSDSLTNLLKLNLLHLFLCIIPLASKPRSTIQMAQKTFHFQIVQLNMYSLLVLRRASFKMGRLYVLRRTETRSWNSLMVSEKYTRKHTR